MTSARTSDLSSRKEEAHVDPMIDRRHPQPDPLWQATHSMDKTQAHACLEKSCVPRSMGETKRPNARDVAKTSSTISTLEQGTTPVESAGAESRHGPSIGLPHAESSEHIMRTARPVERCGRVVASIENPNGMREVAP